MSEAMRPTFSIAQTANHNLGDPALSMSSFISWMERKFSLLIQCNNESRVMTDDPLKLH